MVNKYWLVVIFAAGIALGLWLGHVPDSGQQPDRLIARTSPTIPAVPAAPAPRAPDPPPPVRLPATPATPPPAPNNSAPPSVALIMENVESERYDYGNYSGYSLPVDAGPRFGVQIAESIKEGRNDSLAVEHLQLEREMRDDSWSYPLEAELQNMLATDPVMGKFRIDHLECRATLCELRVSGKDRLQESSEVSRWLRNMSRMRWPGGVTVGTASFAATEDGSEGIVMLRKPPAKG